MNNRKTRILFWPTAWRYLRMLFKDVSFRLSWNMLWTILSLAVVLFVLLGVAGRHWADVYNPADPAPQTWKQFLFGLLGSIDAKPEADAGSVIYSACVRLIGAVVIGGIITSFLCALAERFAEMKLRGLLVPVMRGHFLVIGYGTITDDLIRTVLSPASPEDDLARWMPQERVGPRAWRREVWKRRVLLCTAGDVEKVRETLEAVLPRNVSSRIVYAVGDIGLGSGRDEMCERLRPEDARQIYVVGNEGGPSAGNVENYAFARSVVDYMTIHPPRRSLGFPTPIFTCLSGESSMDVARMSLWDSSYVATSCIRSFDVGETWSRRIWGNLLQNEDSIPLDFAPLKNEGFVHLVVAGLTTIAESLVIEAVRVCHFSRGRPTRITVVDPDGQAEASFFTRHPSLQGVLSDIEIKFLPVRIESEDARNLLRKSALDENCLLTIAICLSRSDSALSAALNLPEEVYWHRIPGSKKNIRASYRENGPRVWVRQNHRSGLVALSDAAANPRYDHLRPFGMQEGGFTPWCFREFAAMYLNAIYDWPNEPGGPSWLDGCAVPGVEARIADFRKKWAAQLAPDNPYGVFDIAMTKAGATEKKDLLLEMLAEGGESEICRFQEYAFRKYIRLPVSLRWANVYVSDSYGAVFRALDLRAVRDRETPFAVLARDNDQLFAERRKAMEPIEKPTGDGEAPGRLSRSLVEVEHNRWMADRALLGYRAPRPGTGEVRDDDFRYHFDMVPFDSLPDQEKGKDEISIACIPLFMALEGIRLEPAQ